jgi:hypothetical protein
MWNQENGKWKEEGKRRKAGEDMVISTAINHVGAPGVWDISDPTRRFTDEEWAKLKFSGRDIFPRKGLKNIK